MTRQEFEVKLIEDLVRGIDYPYLYIRDNKEILRRNKDDFRGYFLNNPGHAYYYSLWIDECPRDDTRESVCKNPMHAYHYALSVDKCSRNDTRKVACKDPYSAYYYAIYVDKGHHKDTFNAVKDTEWEEDYLYYAWEVHNE